MCGRSDPDQLDADIGDAFSEFFGRIIENFEAVARRYSLPAFAVKAVHMLASPVPMKELGRRFHCDPSFITSIADLLDTNGLAQREPDSRDRRIKHLKLTPKGLKFRERIEHEIFTEMPWNYALDTGERETLLALLRKMIKAESERRSQATGQGTEPDSVTAPAGQAASEARSPDAAHDTPPATTGGHRAGEVTREPTPATSSGR
jgi:MarR family transcriptional regulator, organic hydroperoxide resistance regulator